MKRYVIIILDVVLMGYLLFAVSAFNNPERIIRKCTKVNIEIEDESTYGFLDAKEIKQILQKRGLYPIDKNLDDISPRTIEESLRRSPFVSSAECYKTADGHVFITVTQSSPLVRIKSNNGDDYYLDYHGGIMPNSKYTSDLIIVTGSVSKTFARRYVYILANVIMASDLWRNQIEQINVQHDLGIELVPRVGDHIIFLGYLPASSRQSQRQEEVTEFVTTKLNTLEKFYRYGLKEAGWNKYERINVQFSNQIICTKRHDDKAQAMVIPEEVQPAPQTDSQTAADQAPATPASGTEASATSEPKKTEQKKTEPKKTEPQKQESKKVDVKKTDNKKTKR